MKEIIDNTILIGKDAHLYLARIQRKQRGCKPLTKEQEEEIWEKIPKYKNTQLRQVDSNCYGGGDGTYHGCWWSWSTEDLKRMLTEAGFPWNEAEPVRHYIPF